MNNQLKMFILALTILPGFHLNAQTKQETTIGLTTVCNTVLTDSDNERAIINFNTSTQVLEMTTDIFEVLDNKAMKTDMEFEDDEDGMPLRLTCRFEIPDLDFRTSADNGKTFTFDTVISCNGREATQRVSYTFFYSPQVAQRDNSPLTPYGFDFSVSIDPQKFGLDLANGCNEIMMRVQDATLNKTTK